jgi:multisubunit Na+/H+ antiporter MnhE subunit
MSFWTIIDDSISVDELLVGAGAAALAATLAELIGYQAAARFRMRIEWAVPALRLPGEVVRDTIIVFTALWRRLVRGEEPPSGFREIPARAGDDSEEGVTRRVLLVGGRSVAPNTYVAGIDRERAVMIVHQLVASEGKAVD